MQIYNVPYNFKHEEKVFGGYVSIRQAIYLIFGENNQGKDAQISSICILG